MKSNGKENFHLSSLWSTTLHNVLNTNWWAISLMMAHIGPNKCCGPQVHYSFQHHKISPWWSWFLTLTNFYKKQCFFSFLIFFNPFVNSQLVLHVALHMDRAHFWERRLLILEYGKCRWSSFYRNFTAKVV